MKMIAGGMGPSAASITVVTVMVTPRIMKARTANTMTANHAWTNLARVISCGIVFT